MKSIDDIISEVIKAEGGYSDNPNDTGGKTMYGITEAVARANGYTGNMRDLPESFARDVYMKKYVVEPGFSRIFAISPLIGAELVDTGVNMGTATAGKFLQRALNAFNQRGKLWSDLVVDGGIGQKSVDAFASYMKSKGAQEGERVMLVALNALQGTRYIELCESRQENEAFGFGWMRNRVEAQLFAA